MAKIYLVTSGEYSSYQVEAVFDEAHREDAERLVAACKFNEIEERELNPALPAEVRAGLSLYMVWMDRDGNSQRVRKTMPVKGQDRPNFFQDKLYMAVWAKDESHAAKIVNEKRVQLLAASVWGE